MASTMLIMSHTVEDLGNQLKRDESLTDDPAKYQRARRNIQNNMGKDLILIKNVLVRKLKFKSFKRRYEICWTRIEHSFEIRYSFGTTSTAKTWSCPTKNLN